MKKVLLFSLFISAIFIVGCDNGNTFVSQKVPSNLKVQIERMENSASNSILTIYAMNFQKQERTLTFVCPCHLPDPDYDSFLNVQVVGDVFKVILLPDAEYNVKVQYWKPNTDGNTEVEFKVSR